MDKIAGPKCLLGPNSSRQEIITYNAYLHKRGRFQIN
jgi:hypothetical protein